MKIFSPKSINFFELFDNASHNVIKAASLLAAVFQDMDNLEMISREIRTCEKGGDILTSDIIKKTNQTFTPPSEHEGPHSLAIKVHDFVDMIWASVNKLTIFRLSLPTKEAIA